jgi:hypothetical protein
MRHGGKYSKGAALKEKKVGMECKHWPNNLRFSLLGHDHGAHLDGVEDAIKLFAPFYRIDIGYLVNGTF